MDPGLVSGSGGGALSSTPLSDPLLTLLTVWGWVWVRVWVDRVDRADSDGVRSLSMLKFKFRSEWKYTFGTDIGTAGPWVV